MPVKVIEDLKPKARDAGLWNLFLPRSPRAPQGLSNLEYAPLCEIMGRIPCKSGKLVWVCQVSSSAITFRAAMTISTIVDSENTRKRNGTKLTVH